MRIPLLPAILPLLLCVAGADADVRSIDDAAIADESNTSEWLAYGRTHSEQRFSPLDQIHTGSVAALKPDWYLDLPGAVGLVATPLVADGVMYFSGSKNIVRAVDARTGKLLWQYDPRVAEVAGDRLRVAFLHGSRGVALWKGRVYVATVDGRLIALDAATGAEQWSVMTLDPKQAVYITGAPKVFKDKVLVGNGGTENGPSRGYVTAYDAATGKQAWRFYIVPGNPADGFESPAMEMAAKTWTGEWWKMGGGGNAWHGFTYDPEFDAVYIGTGNGAPWNRKIRSPGGGDNLFLCSVVALDPDTGAYRWHYQTTPGETWDYNSNMDIVLADLKIDGKPVKALMHAPKNGFFYVIDRATGKLVSAEKFAEVNWASHIDMATGRPVEVPGARYESGEAVISPGPLGAHNWPSMSFNPRTGFAYFPTIHQRYRYDDTAVNLQTWQPADWLATVPTEGTGVGWSLAGHRSDGIRGSLQAWDPVNQRQVWEVDLPVAWNPGTLTTAGNLVFAGRADGDFVAYDARTGKELWRMPLGAGIAAPPITYALDGRQFVALLVGWGGAFAALGGADAGALGWSYGRQTRRLVVFSLEGKAQLPSQPSPLVPQPLEAPFFEVQSAKAEHGKDVYGQCFFCHGDGAISGGMSPDLRASPTALDAKAFAEVVRSGARRPMGMPSFEGLTDAHLEALRHYIRQQANLALDASP
ncbi:MAG: PQQ-dependent dehydrogenase, methanol/ethanol family [Pseudomonadales bacterium]